MTAKIRYSFFRPKITTQEHSGGFRKIRKYLVTKALLYQLS